MDIDHFIVEGRVVTDETLREEYRIIESTIAGLMPYADYIKIRQEQPLKAFIDPILYEKLKHPKQPTPLRDTFMMLIGLLILVVCVYGELWLLRFLFHVLLKIFFY